MPDTGSDSQVFYLSFLAMFKLGLRWLGWAMIGIVGLFAGLLVLFYALGGMPFSVAPLMLMVIPSVLMLVVCLSLLACLCLFWSKSVTYVVSELGVAQKTGPVKRSIEWLQMRELYWNTLFGIQVFRIKTHTLDTPISVYYTLLNHPEAFTQAWEQCAHRHSVAARQKSQLFGDTLNQAAQALPPPSAEFVLPASSHEIGTGL